VRLFVDTSAWLALDDENDQYHEKAVAKSSEIKRLRIELITSEYIIVESVTLIRYRVSHKAAIIFGDSLLSSRIVKILNVTNEDRLKAWEMFKKYDDKDLSFTDCTSFISMRNLRLQKAFAFDDHFKQIGFELF